MGGTQGKQVYAAETSASRSEDETSSGIMRLETVVVDAVSTVTVRCPNNLEPKRPSGPINQMPLWISDATSLAPRAFALPFR